MSAPIDRPFLRFHDAPTSSLVSHLTLLYKELMDKAAQAENNNDIFWYRDAAALVSEVTIRYDRLAMEKEYAEARKDSER
jgi:hypothetical protein